MEGRELRRTKDLITGVVVRSRRPVDRLGFTGPTGPSSIAVAAADRTLAGRALLLDLAQRARRWARGIVLARRRGRGGQADAEGEETENCDPHDGSAAVRS